MTTMKYKLDTLVYVLFVIAIIGMSYSVYTKNAMLMIPSVYAIFVFGSCICVSKLMNKRIKEIENNASKGKT